MSPGEQIKTLRKALGLTQALFASRINLKASTISAYESGVTTPSSHIITLISQVFGVRDEWLQFGTGEMFRIGVEANSTEKEKLYATFPQLSQTAVELMLKIKTLPDETVALIKIITELPLDKQFVILDIIKDSAKEIKRVERKSKKAQNSTNNSD